MGKCDYNWDPQRLRFLLNRIDLSEVAFAEKSGISLAVVRFYMSGRSTPGLSHLVRMSDFFNIPLDYLAGRCSDNEENLVKETFYKAYKDRGKDAFEKIYFKEDRDIIKAFCGSKESLDANNIDRPWPYNLIFEVCEKDVFYDEDHEKGLSKALDSLSDKEQDCIYQRYMNGLPLQNIGDTYSVTREYIRQIIKKAIDKLRMSPNIDMIQYGLRGSGIYQRSKYITKMDKYLKLKEKNIQSKIQNDLALIPISEIDLSTRSYNALIRAGAESLQDVKDMASSGNLENVKNLGSKSIREIYDILHKYEKVALC